MRKHWKLVSLVLGIVICLTAAMLLCREVHPAGSPSPRGVKAYAGQLPVLLPVPEEQYSGSVTFYFQDFSGK